MRRAPAPPRLEPSWRRPERLFFDPDLLGLFMAGGYGDPRSPGVPAPCPRCGEYGARIVAGGPVLTRLDRARGRVCSWCSFVQGSVIVDD